MVLRSKSMNMLLENFLASLTMSRRTITYRVTKANHPTTPIIYSYKKLTNRIKPKFKRHWFEDDLIDYASWTVADFYPDEF
uniref:Transcriptional regulator n=1 Tax=Panagrellus redivivus TaxID=6233 RepID=A0A7E4USH0_PANRE